MHQPPSTQLHGAIPLSAQRRNYTMISTIHIPRITEQMYGKEEHTLLPHFQKGAVPTHLI